MVVDLGEVKPIAEAVLYNRLDSPQIAARAKCLSILTSDNDRAWTRIYRHEAQQAFGGIQWPSAAGVADPPVTAQFLRAQLDSCHFLHLDQVQIFAEHVPAGDDAALPAQEPTENTDICGYVSRAGFGLGARPRLSRELADRDGDAPGPRPRRRRPQRAPPCDAGIGDCT